MFSRFSVFLAVVRQLFDGSVAGVESDLGGGFLVEEHLLRISTWPNCPMGNSPLQNSLEALNTLTATRSGTL